MMYNRWNKGWVQNVENQGNKLKTIQDEGEE
jgi:hypothetical protein